MKVILFPVLFINIFFCQEFQDKKLALVYSKTYKEGNELFSASIEDYKENEFWGVWSLPIGECKTSSYLPDFNNISYKSVNLYDYDLNTAWMVKDYGINEYLEFKLDFSPGDISKAYQFNGICNIFNGYCKSFSLWKDNSRVKRLKVYFNNIPICFIILIDTWKLQSFDFRKFLFSDKLKQVKNSKNVLKFEIIEVYKGDKYKEVGFSEFLGEGNAN
jgi:hypothetical protein